MALIELRRWSPLGKSSKNVAFKNGKGNVFFSLRITLFENSLKVCPITTSPCRYYINYKLMKKKVNQYGRQLQGGNLERRQVLKDFSKMLDNQVLHLLPSPKFLDNFIKTKLLNLKCIRRSRKSHCSCWSNKGYLQVGYRG